MAKPGNGTRDDVRTIVFDYLSEECEVPINQLSDSTNVIRVLEGDSLMLTELIEIFKKKYRLTIEFKIVGKYIARHQAETIGSIIDLIMLIIEYGNGIADLD